jgi:hypothetical protein
MAGVIAGRAAVLLTGDSSKMKAALTGAQQAMFNFGKEMQRIGTQIMSKLVDMTNKFGESADRIAKASRRSGIAVKDLSALDFIAQRSGTSLESVEIGVRNMGRAITESRRGLQLYTDLFKELGLSTRELAGMDQIQRFDAIGKAIASIEDPAAQAAYAMRIFGRSGTQLLPIFQSGSRGIDEMRKRAQELGGVLTDEMAANAEKLVDAQTDWATATKGLANAVGNALAPALTELTKIAATWLGWVNRILRENKFLVTGSFAIGAAIAAIGTVMMGVASSAIIPWGAMWSAVAKFFSATLIPILTKAGAVMLALAKPVLLVGGAIAGIAYVATGLVFGFDRVNASLSGLIAKFLELTGTMEIATDTWASLASAFVGSRFGDALLSDTMRKEIADAQQMEVERVAIQRAQRSQAPLTQSEVNAINDRVARDIIERSASGKPGGARQAATEGVDVAERVASRAQIMGTFSARGAQGMTTQGGNVLEENSKKQTQYLKRISESIDEVGLLQ